MKKYTFELVIHEGSDDFWESIKGAGCDEVFAQIKDILADYGFFTDDNIELTLKKFEQ